MSIYFVYFDLFSYVNEMLICRKKSIIETLCVSVQKFSSGHKSESDIILYQSLYRLSKVARNYIFPMNSIVRIHFNLYHHELLVT